MFNSFDAFANHLRARIIPAVRQACVESLPEIGREIQHQAAEQIGHYQAAVGPFAAWEPLAQATIDKKSRSYAGFATNYHRGLDGNADSPLYDTGAFHDDLNISIDENRLKIRVGTTKEYIVANELGTDHIPARPVFGPAGIRSMPHNLAYLKNKLQSNIRKVI